MMKRATIAGLFYQATQIAAILLISGVAGIRSLSARTMKRDLAPVTAQTEKDEIGGPAY